jgi:hypothetical protein
MGQPLTQKDLTDFLDGKSAGVYVLWNNFEPIYVGRTISFKARLSAHACDKNFDNVQVIEISEPDQIQALETELIDILRPRLNKQVPSSEWDISWLTEKQPREPSEPPEPSQPVLTVQQLLKPAKPKKPDNREPERDMKDLVLVYVERVGIPVAAEALGVPVWRIRSWIQSREDPPISVAQTVLNKANHSEVKLDLKSMVFRYVEKVGIEGAAKFYSRPAMVIQSWVKGKSQPPLWAFQMLLYRSPKAQKQLADAVGDLAFPPETVTPKPEQMTLFREVLETQGGTYALT